MKKIFGFLVLCLLFCSCSYTTTCVGNITAYNSDGSVLKEWYDVVIEETINGNKQSSSLKQYGLNFYDKYSNSNFIISNSVPFIIEYNVRHNNQTSSNVNDIPYNISKEQKESYINEYKELTKDYKELNKAIKYAVKNNLDYKDLKDRKNVIKKRFKELETIFYCRNITFK